MAIEMSPDEEVAVGRLLTLGHAMWKVDDYKLLHYAVKRYRKEAKRNRASLAHIQPIAGVRPPQMKPKQQRNDRIVSNAAGSSPRIQRKQSEVSFGDVLEDKRFAQHHN